METRNKSSLERILSTFPWLLLGVVSFVASCASTSKEGSAMLVEPLLAILDAAGNARGKYELGRYYQGQDRFDDAIRAYEQALALDPGQAMAANNIGVIEARRGHYDQAIGRFRTALDSQPNDGLIHANLGYAYLMLARNGEALHEFDEALRLDPGNNRARANRQIALQRLVREKAWLLGKPPRQKDFGAS